MFLCQIIIINSPITRFGGQNIYVVVVAQAPTQKWRKVNTLIKQNTEGQEQTQYKKNKM